MTLYSYWRSTTSYRVRAALHLKNIPFDTKPVDLMAGDQHDPAYAALNPGHCVPTLVLDDGTVLTQSLAILDYLDHAYPNRPLLPKDPAARARVLAAAHALAVDVHPVNNLRVALHLRDVYDLPPAQVEAWMRHWMVAGLMTYEAQSSAGATYTFGSSPDLADLCLVAQLYNAHRWGVDLTPFPKVQRIEAACLAHPDIAAAHPDLQPDANP